MSNGEPTLSTLPSEFIAPKGVIQVNRYSEKIYSFTSFTLTNNETLYSAYMGDYGEDHWMEGITIGDKQISCKTAVQSDYRTGLFSTSLEEANTPLSKYPFDEIVEAALQTQLPE
jgi:hypothetical protein